VCGASAGHVTMDLFYTETSVPEKLFKVIIIGDPTVGKTSFVQRYVQNSYERDYKGTVGVDFALKVVKWSETQTVKLQLWDIAGKKLYLVTFNVIGLLKLGGIYSNRDLLGW
jgi:small GTP-binding protein